VRAGEMGAAEPNSVLRPGFPADAYWLCWMRLSHFSSVTSDRDCGSCCSYLEIPTDMPGRSVATPTSYSYVATRQWHWLLAAQPPPWSAAAPCLEIPPRWTPRSAPRLLLGCAPARHPIILSYRHPQLPPCPPDRWCRTTTMMPVLSATAAARPWRPPLVDVSNGAGKPRQGSENLATGDISLDTQAQDTASAAPRCFGTTSWGRSPTQPIAHENPPAKFACRCCLTTGRRAARCGRRLMRRNRQENASGKHQDACSIRPGNRKAYPFNLLLIRTVGEPHWNSCLTNMLPHQHHRHMSCRIRG
jgi:hypothetical protein